MTQLIKPQIKWTQDKIDRFVKEYPLGDKEKLAESLGVTYEALKSAAIRFGVKSMKDICHHKLKPLYDESCLSYYWMGFIMADGHLDKDGELRIALSANDKDHLKKLSNLLGSDLKTYEMKDQWTDTARTYCRFSCKDVRYGKLLLDRFGVKKFPKTTNAPDINIVRDDYFLAFLLGIIDGDGTFSKSTNGHCAFIRIEMHSAWETVLRKFADRLASIGVGNVSITTSKRGYVQLRIYKHQNLKFLKLFSLHHELPRLERKWSCIDENRTVKYVKKGDIALDSERFFQV